MTWMKGMMNQPNNSGTERSRTTPEPAPVCFTHEMGEHLNQSKPSDAVSTRTYTH